MTIVQLPIADRTAPPPTPAPTFTLSSSLRWLGHDCSPRCCAEPMETLTATVWFLRSEQQFVYPLRALVLVDSVAVGDVPAALLDLIHRVSCCARTDAISVRPRYDRWVRPTTSAEPGDEGRARAAPSRSGKFR